MSEIYGLKTFKDFYIFDLSLICLVIEDSSSLIFYFKEAELRAIGNLGCQSSKKKKREKNGYAHILHFYNFIDSSRKDSVFNYLTSASWY